METQYFLHFIRKNFPDVKVTNEEAEEIGKEFKKYLLEVFKGKEKKLEKIWNISPMKVIMESDHPLKVNGYEPALLIHFDLFVQKMKTQ